MIDIEFRGKRKDTYEWVYGYVFESKMSGVFIIGSKMVSKQTRRGLVVQDELWQHEVIPETVGRFIGVRDKYGSKIYEGDIVTAWSQGSCGKFEIKWREDGGGTPCWLLYPAWQNGDMWNIAASREEDGLVYDKGLTIIGNKFVGKVIE